MGRNRAFRRREAGRRHQAAEAARRAQLAPGADPGDDGSGFFLQSLHEPNSKAFAEDLALLRMAARGRWPMTERFRVVAVKALMSAMLNFDDPKRAIDAVRTAATLDALNLRREETEDDGFGDDEDGGAVIIDVDSREAAEPFLQGQPVRARIGFEETAIHSAVSADSRPADHPLPGGPPTSSFESYEPAGRSAAGDGSAALAADGLDDGGDEDDELPPDDWTAAGANDRAAADAVQLADLPRPTLHPWMIEAGGSPTSAPITDTAAPPAAASPTTIQGRPVAIKSPTVAVDPGAAVAAGGAGGQNPATPPEIVPPEDHPPTANGNGNGNGHGKPSTPGGLFGMMQRRTQGRNGNGNGSNGNGNGKH